MTKIEVVSTAAIFTRSLEKPRSPAWKPVSAWRSASPAAILPNAVAEPVATTTPRPAPWWTTVPMNAQEGRSTVESLAGTGSAVLTAGIGSPVRTASSHSSWSASSSRRSAGTRSPTRRATTSPGTRSRTSRRCWLPSRQTRAWWRMPACSAATASSERYSLTKPRPTLKPTIAAMMAPSVGSPVAADTAAAASSKISSGLRSWRPRTPRAVTLWEASTLRPTLASRPAASSEVRPVWVLPSSWSTAPTG